MSRNSKAATIFILLLAGAAVAVWGVRHIKNRTTTLRGAVITANPDPRKQLPISGAEITATDGISVVRSTSDSSGLFAIVLRKRIFRGHLITLRFRHMDYEPLNMSVLASGKIYLAEMMPIQSEKPIARSLATQTRSNNVVVKYSIKTATVVNIGSAVRSFEVPNKGNQPCERASSMLARWKMEGGGRIGDSRRWGWERIP